MDNQTNIEQTEQRPPQTPPQAGPAQAPNAGAAPARPPQQPRRDERPMPQRPPQGAEQIRRDEKMVYIGKKEAMSYVLAVVTQFNNNLPEVHIKARGKSISRAVDVAEVKLDVNARVSNIVALMPREGNTGSVGNLREEGHIFNC